jgi:hypothetical protein
MRRLRIAESVARRFGGFVLPEALRAVSRPAKSLA